MSSKDSLIEQFRSLILFAESLRTIDDATWTAPIGEGKWAARDVIAHMMRWDRYFFEEAIAKLTNGEAVTVRHLNYDEFNRKAMEYAKTISRAQLIDETVRWRGELIGHLSRLSEEEFVRGHTDGDGHPFSAFAYVQDFIPHDAHHIDQLNRFFASCGQGEAAGSK